MPYYRAVCDVCDRQWEAVGDITAIDGIKHRSVSSSFESFPDCPGTIHVDAEPTIEEES